MTEVEKKDFNMYFISDILLLNHKGVIVYSHCMQTGELTRNGDKEWYRLIVYDKNNIQIGMYKGFKMISKKNGNHYYKFINKNLLNSKDVKDNEKLNSLIEHTISST